MSELSKEQVHGLAIRLVAAIRNRSFRVGHDVIDWEERIYGEDARIAELVLKDFGITGAEGPPPRAETEIERLRQQRDELLAALRNALPVLEFEVETRSSNDLLYEIPAGPVLDAARTAIARAEGRSDE